jgi:hypothetical protein
MYDVWMYVFKLRDRAALFVGGYEKTLGCLTHNLIKH